MSKVNEKTTKKARYELYKDILLKDGRTGSITERFLRNPDPDLYIVITSTFDGESWTDIFVETDEIVGYTQEQLEADKSLRNP